MLLVPYEIETLYQRYPWSNWIIIGLSVLASLLAWFGGLSRDTIAAMVLSEWSLTELVGYQFLHSGFWHLAGNMIFLWVFGNAICTNTNNGIYPALYLCFGILAGVTHLVFGGGPAVGASGAINGVIGMALAMYPVNRVSVFWFIVIRGGTFQCPVWEMALLWFAFDLFGVMRGAGGVAYWAHIGGLISGVLIGLLALHLGWVRLTEYDNRSLLEILKGEHPDR
jgi:membrane associated rhomboid family serine protease